MNDTTQAAHPQRLRITDFTPYITGDLRERRDTLSRQWQLMPYECTDGKGTMLLARPWAACDTVRITPGLSGWYRIRVCLFTDGHPSGGLSLQVDGDRGPSYFVKGLPNSKFILWGMFEMAEEYLWQCADMTGRGITLQRLAESTKASIGLMWLDFEAMTTAEVAAYQADRQQMATRTLHDHTDLDWLGHVPKIDDHLFDSYLQDILASDARVHSVEFYPLLANYRILEEARERHLESFVDQRIKAYGEFMKCHEAAYRRMLEQGHARGHRFYAALRIALSKCPPPYDCSTINFNEFAAEHPEWYCIDRDGRPVSTLSYAFPEVQEYTIRHFLRMTAMGFDGVSLFFHRGVMTLFEAPVLELFSRRHPGVDPRTLPLDDPQLVEIHVELLTGFIRRLREALDRQSAEAGRPRMAINIMCGYSLTDDLRYGVDVRRWSEEKLIDSFVVENMRIWEDAERYASATQEGRIDLEAYRRLNSTDTVAPVHRHFGNELELKLSHTAEHLAISRDTGVTAYFELPWEWSVTPVEYRNYALALYHAGVQNLSLWDCYHKRVMKRSEWQVVSRLGHREELEASPEDHEAYGRSVRMLSLNGLNMSPYHPAWRG